MKIALQFQDPATFSVPLLAVFAVDTASEASGPPSLALLTASGALAHAAAPWLASGEFKAALGETLLLHAPSGLSAQRLLIVGLGKASALGLNELRKGAGVAVRSAKPRSLHEVAIAFPENTALAPELAASVLAQGALLADFDIDTYRSDRKDLTVHTATLLHPPADEASASSLQRGLDEGIILAESQNFARSLINEPGNVLTPSELARRASEMCSEVGLACEVFSTGKILELGMGAFAAVAQGSSQPPALIVIRYEPPIQPAQDTPVLGLVGKGITFDTGGISIKSADNMEKMKYDMGGAAAMLGAMRSIALLKPRVRVLCVVCSAENMPGGRAYKPGDVVTSMSGKTIEIINTDAEGRLVLADGLHYARTLGATHLADAATLTGAIGIALGPLYAGLFANDDAAAQRLLDVLPLSGEKFWRLPCTDDYGEQIKSQIADIRNTGATRYGGASTAAVFLKHFVADTPTLPPAKWVHLDIAATAWSDDNDPWISRGPTGIAVRTLTHWVRGYAK